MGKTMGLDLGTTNSCVSIMEGTSFKIIPNAEGSDTTPSVVAFTSTEKLVGTSARRQAVTNPDNTIFEVKRLIGRKFNAPSTQEIIKKLPYKVVEHTNGDAWVEVNGKAYSPSEISSFIIAKMKEYAEAYLGETVDKIVVTVPAYFDDAQRQATKDACRIAGLEVLRVINEPTASALVYGLDKKDNATVLVWDTGGGTHDISILEIENGLFEVKATNGDSSLGGADFDQEIIDYVANEFKKEQGIDLRSDKLALQRLKEAAEKAKIELSSAIQTEISLPFITADTSGPKHLSVKLTRAKFEALTDHLIERTIKPCKQALKDAGLSVSQIDEIIMVGGMTRMPKIIETVKNIFGKEPNRSVNPDLVVSAGASLQAGVLAGDVKDVLLLDVTPLSLGIETLGGVFTKIIDRNTTIPTQKSQVFSTAEDNQPAVTIKVAQGERQFVKDNKLLGQFELTGIAPAPRGLPQIEVSFNIDANGIVDVKATDKATGKEQQIKIQSSGGLSEADIKRMIEEAELNADSDKKKRELIDVKNQADSLIHQTEKTIKDLGDKISETDKTLAETGIKNLKEVLSSDDIEVIKTKSGELTQVAMKIGEQLYKSQQEADQKVNDTPTDSGTVDAEFTEVKSE
jgi:molecular chaperone DnaK